MNHQTEPALDLFWGKGEKWAYEEVTEINYSKYGIVKGRLEEHDAIACGVVLCGWPGWALAAKLRGWVVCALIVKDTRWHKLLTYMFPDALIINYMDCERWWSLVIKIDTWLTDIDPPSISGYLSLITVTLCSQVEGPDQLQKGCDLACILDTKIQGLPCPAPQIPAGIRPQVIEVWPGIYYGGGLFPLKASNPCLVCHASTHQLSG
jgi:hypothetical protein